MARYLEHTTLGGERWDTLAARYYGDATAYGGIIAANPHVDITPVLGPGVRLSIPVIDAPPASRATEDLPPWKR